MNKLLFLTLGSLALTIPLQSVQANTTFYDDSEKLLIDFPSDWYEFSENMYKQIDTVTEKAFMTKNGEAELYVEEIPKDNEKAVVVNRLIKHLQTVESERQKPEKYISSLETSFGMNITSYKFNSNYSRLILEMKQSSKAFGEINVKRYWIIEEEKIVELKFYQFEYTKNTNEEIQYIIDSAKVGDEINGNAENNVIQGDFDENKVVAQDDQGTTIVEKIIHLFKDHTVWWITLGTFLLYLIGLIVYKLA